MRLRTRWLAGIGLVLALAVVIVGGGLWAVQTRWGQERLRRYLMAEARTALGDQARLDIGALQLGANGRFVLDSLDLREASGAPILISGPIRGRIDLRALLDRRVRLDSLVLDRVRASLEQGPDRRWNIARLGRTKVRVPVVDRPWLTSIGTLVVRSSSIAIGQLDSLPTMPLVRRRFTEIDLVATGITSPDGAEAGVLTLASLATRIDAPPLTLTRATGQVRFWGDSIQLDLPTVALPNSEGRVKGSIAWGVPSKPVQLALRLDVTRTEFRDIAWITALLPERGNGNAVVHISNGATSDVIRYRLDSLEARGTGSRIRGGFTADVGRKVAITDLLLSLEPLDLALVREIFGDSVPAQPWDGAVRGTLKASGGRLDRWKLEEARVEFLDRRVGTARSRLRASGTLDFLARETTFAPLDLRFDSLDVRTVGAVTALADTLSGFLRGSVRLVGPLSDYRFTDLVATHIDGAHPRSIVRGFGRLRTDVRQQWLTADLLLDSLSLPALGRLATTEPLAGVLSGTLLTSAVGDSLALDLRLHGNGARFHWLGATSLDSTKVVALGDVTVDSLDVGRFLATSTLPPHALSASFVLGLDGPLERPLGRIAATLRAGSAWDGTRFASGDAAFTLGGDRVTIDSLALIGDAIRISGSGALGRGATIADSLTFHAESDSPPLLFRLLGDTTAVDSALVRAGTVMADGIVTGTVESARLRGAVLGRDLSIGTFAPRAVTARFDIENLPDRPAGRLVVETVASDSLSLLASGTFLQAGDSLTMQLDSLRVRAPSADWSLVRPADFSAIAETLTLDSLLLRSTDGGSLALSALIAPTGPMRGTLRMRQVPLSQLSFTGLLASGLSGAASADLTAGGTREEPTFLLTASLDSVAFEGKPLPTLDVTGRYANERLALTGDGRFEGREAVRVAGSVPLDLGLRTRGPTSRLPEQPLDLTFTADRLPLVVMQPWLPSIRDVRGVLDASVVLAGRWGAIEPRGTLKVTDGAFGVPALATGFRSMSADVALAPDSVVLRQFSIRDESEGRDAASATGTMYRRNERWQVELESTARDFRVIDDPQVAQADLSWQLRLRGPLDGLVLAGALQVPRGSAFIGRSERSIFRLEEEIAAADSARRYYPRLEALTLTLGNDVRLRSPEANVQLNGSVQITGTLDAPDIRGAINAARGTYRLDLGPLQRTFQVDSGAVRLNGPIEIAPTLDIHTSYTVRQADREDVHIQARLTGSLDEPRIVLSSTDIGSSASETEIISYLLFGSPSFALDGQSASAVRSATAALVPSLGGVVERALGGKIPLFSSLQVTTIAGNAPTGFTLNSFEGLLNSVALIAGRQLGSDSYLNVSGGVCRGENRAARSLPAWFGIGAEYRPRERLSAQISLDPGSAPCTRVGGFSQIYQFGVDIFRDWRW